MGNRNGREFLLGTGVIIANAAASPLLIADDSQVNPNLITFAGDPTPEGKSLTQTTESDSRKAAGRGKMRGLMVDAGRVPETVAYYKRVIEFCADWELNTLQFRLADDQGSAMRFSSVLDLVTHRNAFTPEQLKDLAEYGQSHGVDLIPELESFGHTGYITRSPAYAHGSFLKGAAPRCSHCDEPLSANSAAFYIERNAPGTVKGWRWQQNWSGCYCIVIEGKKVDNNVR